MEKEDFPNLLEILEKRLQKNIVELLSSLWDTKWVVRL